MHGCIDAGMDKRIEGLIEGMIEWLGPLTVKIDLICCFRAAEEAGEKSDMESFASLRTRKQAHETNETVLCTA